MNSESRSEEKVYHNAGNHRLLKLLVQPPGHALDCGCGDGANARLLKQKGWRITGITLSESERALASEQCEQVLIANLENGLPAEAVGPFDLVILSHVLEHLAYPQKLLADIARALSPQGEILVALPNILNWRQRVRFLRGDFEYQASGLMDNTHLRFYTFDTGRRMLETNGYQILAADCDGSVPLWPVRRLLPGSVTRRLDEMGSKHWPNLFGGQSLFRAVPGKRSTGTTS